VRVKLYARELLEKLVNEKELKILEVLWDYTLDPDQQIELLLKAK